MAILDRSWGLQNTANTNWTVTRSSGSYGTGTVIAIIVMSNTVFNTPATASLRASNTTAMGVWGFSLAGTGQASIPMTCTVAGTGQWYAWELSAGSNFDFADAYQSGGGLSTVTLPTLTPTAGPRHMLAAAGANATPTFTVSSWSNSYVGWGGGHATNSDFTFSQAADRDYTADGVTGITSVATFPQNMDPRSAVHMAFIAAAGDTTPPTAPTGLSASAIGSTTVDLTWSASTDDVAVTGYEIQVIGP